MTRIKQTDIVPPHMIVAAKMFHQGRGEERVRLARLYMVSDRQDGSGMQEYLLTRYVNRLGVAMSSILELAETPLAKSHVSIGEHAYQLVEVCREERKKEEQMIVSWCTGKGGTTCETEYLT